MRSGIELHSCKYQLGEKGNIHALLPATTIDFDDIIESLKVMRSFGGWTSINYFVFPGMTDSVAEYEALRKADQRKLTCA
ncbi:MAG: hypothetical protein WDN26_02785 [Chitinophagaceae bacterium]